MTTTTPLLRAAATALLWAAASPTGEFRGAYATEREARAAAGKTGTVYDPAGLPLARRRRTPRPAGVLTWRRRYEAEGWAAHYESTDGRWRVRPVAYTVTCDGYLDGHLGCPGNTEHTHEEWQLAELIDGRWVDDEELYPRLRDAQAVAERLTTRRAAGH